MRTKLSACSNDLFVGLLVLSNFSKEFSFITHSRDALFIFISAKENSSLLSTKFSKVFPKR